MTDTQVMRLLLAVAVLSMGCNKPQAAAPPAPLPVVMRTVEGRVADQHDAGIGGLFVLLRDSTQISGNGHRTTMPQESLRTDDDGRFQASLSFQPNEAVVNGSVKWVELPRERIEVMAGAPINIAARSIEHTTVSGLVVDAEGKPMPGVSVMPEAEGPAWATGSDENGHFSIEVVVPAPPTYRVRRMGYSPISVELAGLQRIVLSHRRPIVTVTVLEPNTQEPVTRLVQVELWESQKRLSSCTAGDAKLTKEPVTGACSLDAVKGTVEVRLQGKQVATITVSDAPQAISVVAAPK